MGDFIEWDVVSTARERMLVDVAPSDGGYGEGIRPATIDDLKRACEAVGLHVVDRSESERQSRDLEGIHDALDPRRVGTHASLVDLANGVYSALTVAQSENSTLRAQLAEAEARITKSEQETEIPLDTLRWSYVDACERLGVDRGDLCAGISKALERAEDAEKRLAALTSPEGRATDEELRTIYAKAQTAAEGVIAVAARVRREPGLVERLVDAKAEFHVSEDERATWTVRVCLRGYTTNVTDLTAADVPATIGRLAGLDGGT